MPKADFGGLGKGAGQTGNVVAFPTTGQGREVGICPKCRGLGWLRRETEDRYAIYGAAVPCDCGSRWTRAQEHRAYLAFLERDRQLGAAIRAGLGLPALPDIATAVSGPEAPPEGFAKGGVPVPSMVSEEQRLQRKAELARAMANLSGRMRMGRAREA